MRLDRVTSRTDTEFPITPPRDMRTVTQEVLNSGYIDYVHSCTKYKGATAKRPPTSLIWTWLSEVELSEINCWYTFLSNCIKMDEKSEFYLFLEELREKLRKLTNRLLSPEEAEAFVGFSLQRNRIQLSVIEQNIKEIEQSMVQEKERVAPDSPKTEPAEDGSSQKEQIEPHQLELHQQVVQQLFGKTTGSGESPEFPDETSKKFSEPEVPDEFPDKTSKKFSEPEVPGETSEKRSKELIELELQDHTSRPSHRMTRRRPMTQLISGDPCIVLVLVLIAFILALLLGATTIGLAVSLLLQ